jgi:hypothetical protein
MTILDVLAEHKVDYVESGHHHSREGWVQLRHCPFCSSDKYHLGYRTGTKSFNCWRCGYHSAWSVFVALGIPTKLLHDIGEKYIRPDPKVAGKLKEPEGRGRFLAAHRRYLRERGLDPKEIATLWHAQGIGIATRLSWRIYIPILWQGKVVSWTTRAIGKDVGQRYISASAAEEDVNHKTIVYGMDYVHHTVLVCEGPFDVWNIGTGAVCLFGLDYLSSQVLWLSKIPTRAQTQAHKLAAELSVFPGTTQTLQIDAADPGSASPKEVKLIRRVSGLA